MLMESCHQVWWYPNAKALDGLHKTAFDPHPEFEPWAAIQDRLRSLALIKESSVPMRLMVGMLTCGSGWLACSYSATGVRVQARTDCSSSPNGASFTLVSCKCVCG